MRIDTRGLSFDVHTGGPADGPVTLLLHGFPQHSGEWDLVAPALHAEGLRTVAVDQRGYSPGARPADPAAYAMAECVVDALAVLDVLGVSVAHLVGHDWGALVGWQLAARHPGRVASLTAVSVPHPLAMAAAATDPDQRERSAYIRAFRQDEAERQLLADDAAMLRRVLDGVPSDRVERYLRPLREPGALTGPLNWYRAMSAADVAGLGPVDVATTYVWSDGDLAIGRVAAEGCAAHVVGDYRFVALAGVSHWIPDEAAGALTEAVLERIEAADVAPRLPAGGAGE